MNAVGHEVKGHAAFHHNRFAGVMCKYECRNGMRRFVAPPAFPIVVEPRTANRAEHVATQDPCTFSRYAFSRKAVVNARLTALAAVLLFKGLGRKEPLNQLRPADVERILKALICPGGKIVKRNTNTLNYNFLRKK